VNKSKFKKKIKQLFGHQIGLLFPLAEILIKLPFTFPKAIYEDLARNLANLKYKYFYKPLGGDVLLEKIKTIHPFLEQSSFDANKVKISFCGATRRKSNPNNKLDLFLGSVIDNAHNISEIEILLAIDPDDDLDYFIWLKNRFKDKCRLLIFITEKRYGYENLHKYDAFLFPNLAPNTRMICDYSDDCRIIKFEFDVTLLTVDASHADNIYFIHTRDIKRENYLGDASENLQLLYWVMQAKEPASYFPIFSKKVLDIAYEYARLNDMNNEWSPVANAWICDCYIDILATYVKSKGSDRIHYLNLIEMNKTVLANYQYPDFTTGLTPNNRAFIKMLNNRTLNYLNGLAESIVEHIKIAKVN
jgi:hypothetical protein